MPENFQYQRVVFHVNTLDFDILRRQEGSCLTVLRASAMFGTISKNANTDGRQYMFVVIYSSVK